MSSSARYECEIRFIVEDRERLMERISMLEGRTVKKYKFTDHILKPTCGDGREWIRDYKILRIREWHLPERVSELIFTHTRIVNVEGMSFKRTLYPRGKIVMYRGGYREALSLAEDLGFQKWYSVVKMWGRLIELARLDREIIALEQVEGLGTTVEVEVWGEDASIVSKRMLRVVEGLGFDIKDALPKPLPVIVAERQGLI